MVKTYCTGERSAPAILSRRSVVTHLRTSRSIGTLRDLLDFIWKRDNLNQPCDASWGNSKEFAKAIFQFKTEGEDL